MPVDVTRQFVIIARLGDFCDYSSHVARYEEDPWNYMRGKLQELVESLTLLKAEQLRSACDRFLKGLQEGAVHAGDLADFKQLLDSYLSGGDYADVAIHLDTAVLTDPARTAFAARLMREVRPTSLFDEDSKPEAERSARARRLIDELTRRLGLDLCARVLERKPRTPRRKRMVLRRIRRSVAEYCAVLHLPTSPEDTFSPFLLPRVEALVVACLRVLNRFR